MLQQQDIKVVTVVGTGTIGASWSCLFLAHGLDVVATDVRDDAESKLRTSVERCWRSLPETVLALGRRGSLRFVSDLEAACEAADFVQESATERLEEKIKLIQRIDASTRPNAVVASSSSAISVTDMQSACQHAERVVLGHPFNPPHLVPLVEIAGGAQTDSDAVAIAERFYAGLGKVPVRLQKEVYGHVANRLQAAIFREAIHLLEAGAASVEDIDSAVTGALGPRWALMGPFLTYHLAGGDKGMQGFWNMFAPMQEKLWTELGGPVPDLGLQSRVTDAVESAYGGNSVEALAERRDVLLRELLAVSSGRTSLCR